MEFKYLFICILILFGCNSENTSESVQVIDSSEISVPINSDSELEEFIEEDYDHNDDLYKYPKISENSLNGLKIVQKQWSKEDVICLENESFVLVRKVNFDRLIAVSYVELPDVNEYRFFLNDIEKNQIVNKIQLKNADFSIDNSYNFKFYDSYVVFYENNDFKKENIYDLLDNTISESLENVLDWDKILDWRQQSYYVSNMKSKMIKFSDTSLDLINYNIDDTMSLINQEYEGSWSFGSAVWNYNDTKFYFDNSGAVACIWEIDLEKMTLDKIVPEHWASNPIILSEEDGIIIVYCEETCLKTVQLK